MQSIERYNSVFSEEISDQTLTIDAPIQVHSTQVSLIDPSFDKRWDEFVLNHEHGTLYHSSSWKEIIQKTYGYEPLYFILEDESRRILAGLPFFMIKKIGRRARLVSLPLSDSCDPLYSHRDHLDELIQAVMEKYTEVRANRVQFKLDKEPECLDHLGLQRIMEDKNHVLELPHDFRDLLAVFPKDIRRSIRKAEKSNLKLLECGSISDLKIFYRLLLENRKRLGLPPQPFSFFKNIWNQLGRDNRVYCLIALEDSRPIAACLGAIFKETMYSLYACSDSRFLKNRPNHWLIWKEMEKADELGLRYYDFGRTAADNAGLLQFKRKWRAEERDYYHVDFPQIKSSYGQKKSRNAYSFLSGMMPRPIFRMSGRIIYQYFS